ncbi:MAG: c-type cytochrome [Akkermansiaceae bacterium]|jgi:mono/diheme cytochrome c family protein
MSDQSSSSELRPDLNESINVAVAHQSIQEATPAAGREKRLLENGMEPVSLWLILASAIVVLVGGAVMGQGGAFFAYKEVMKDGYMRSPSYVQGEVVLLPAPALDLFRKEGIKHFGSKCSGCHQPSGAGQPGNGIPPLAGSEWVNGNTDMLAQIVLHGLKGPITVAGASYNNNMPAMGEGLGRKELATLLTYIRSEWGNTGSLVTMEMAENALEIAKARGSDQVTVEELKKNHDKMLDGANLAPDTLVDPITLEPADAAAE